MANNYTNPRSDYLTRARANSSSSSKYIPDGYPSPAPQAQPAYNAYLMPPDTHQQQQLNPVSYQPSDPEQYRRSPRIPRDVPPAQLPLDYDDSAYRDIDESNRRPSVRDRHGSTSSYRSGRSHQSHHSHGSHPRHSHEQDHRRHRHFDDDAERFREGENQPQHSHHHHQQDSYGHSHDDSSHKLSRRDTPRGYGSSLWAVGDWIKAAFKRE